MAEYRLFEAGTVPEYTTREFFEAHPWIDPAHQFGHTERTAMVSALIHDITTNAAVGSIVDLGCGDGSLLSTLQDLDIPCWGYDAGTGNVDQARSRGLDVRRGDLQSPDLDYADLIVCTEVVEHLTHPHDFIKALPGRRLVLSSPSAETIDWHYEHHAWAWDPPGYAEMVTAAGWTVVDHRECDAPPNCHGGVWRPQRFQALAAIRGTS